jgi:hypothetical protein
VSVVASSQERQPSWTGRLPRRDTDRVEDIAAWVLTAAALFVLLGAVLGGVGLYGGAVDQARAAAHERTPVAAVLVDDPVPDATSGTWTSRSAYYVDAAGSEHDIVVAVAGWPPAGANLRAWVDREGRVVDAPLTDLEAVVLGASALSVSRSSGASSSAWPGWVCDAGSTTATPPTGVAGGFGSNRNGAVGAADRSKSRHPDRTDDRRLHEHRNR